MGHRRSSSNKLKNLYVYFWRWATLKVFGSGRFAATGLPDTDEEGIVCFITVAGFLNGPGFEKMRDDLRRTCSDIWVIDCSPEGHQPDVPTRIFRGCAAAGLHRACGAQARKGREAAGACAVSRAAEGQAGRQVQGACGAVSRREGLDRLSGELARAVPAGVRRKMGGLRSRFPICSRNLVRASCPSNVADRARPEPRCVRRWESADAGPVIARAKQKLFGPKNADRKLIRSCQVELRQAHRREPSPLGGGSRRPWSRPTRYGFPHIRSPVDHPGSSRNQHGDGQACGRATPDKQVFLTAFEAHSPTSGPAISLTALIPDQASLQRLVRRARLSALGRCAGDAIERARGRVAGAGQGARRGGRRRGPRSPISPR